MNYRDISPHGKYRLTEGGAAVILALANGKPATVNDLAQSIEVRRLRAPGLRFATGDTVRSILKTLERLGLVERVQFTPHRFGYRLTAEGRIDAESRA